MLFPAIWPQTSDFSSLSSDFSPLSSVLCPPSSVFCHLTSVFQSLPDRRLRFSDRGSFHAAAEASKKYLSQGSKGSRATDLARRKPRPLSRLPGRPLKRFPARQAYSHTMPNYARRSDGILHDLTPFFVV